VLEGSKQTPSHDLVRLVADQNKWFFST